MSGRALAAAVIVAMAAGPAAAQRQPFIPPQRTQLPYTVTAPKGATYTLSCRFRAVRAKGAFDLDYGYVNKIELSPPNARSGLLPTDNGRCLLTQKGNTGPITLTIVKAGRRYATTVRKKGQSAHLIVQ